MNRLTRRQKSYLLLIVGIITVILLDLSPMIYQRTFGNGRTFVEHYAFNISGDSLLAVLNEEYGLANTTGKKAHIKEVKADENGSGYTYVLLYRPKLNDHIHLWVGTTEELSERGHLVFYGISGSSDKEKCNRINRDHDFIFRNLTLNSFEELVIEDLRKKGITQQNLKPTKVWL